MLNYGYVLGRTVQKRMCHNCRLRIFVLKTWVSSLQMESKFKAEMEDHKYKLDREYETLRFNFQKELDRLRVKHQQDLDKRVSFFVH